MDAGRKGTLDYYTSPQSLKIIFSYSLALTTLGTFYWNLIGWDIWLSVSCNLQKGTLCIINGDGWVDGLMDGYIEGWMDYGWMNGLINVWMDGLE